MLILSGVLTKINHTLVTVNKEPVSTNKYCLGSLQTQGCLSLGVGFHWGNFALQKMTCKEQLKESGL